MVQDDVDKIHGFSIKRPGEKRTVGDLEVLIAEDEQGNTLKRVVSTYVKMEGKKTEINLIKEVLSNKQEIEGSESFLDQLPENIKHRALMDGFVVRKEVKLEVEVRKFKSERSEIFETVVYDMKDLPRGFNLIVELLVDVYEEIFGSYWEQFTTI